MSKLPTNAVILARGLGTRMRATLPDVRLTHEQEQIAAAGIKALIPIAGGKTLLELIIANLTASGFSEICLVIGPEHELVRQFCAEKNLRVEFAVQLEAKGTADAVLSIENRIPADDLFLVVNSDNLYKVDCLRRLRETNHPAMLAYDRASLIARSNIPAERIAKFAIAEVDGQGYLSGIVEKPDHIDANTFVSMNAWLFSTKIFKACHSIGPSARGEYELTTAVQYAIDYLGEQIVAVSTNEGVLDLSSRADIEGVSRFLNQT